MILTPSASLANATAALWLSTLQAGVAASSIKIYTGSKPANTSVAPDGTTQKLLGTCNCATVAVGGVDVGSVTTNRLTFGPIAQDAAADDSGTATWARVLDGDGVAVFDIDASSIAGTGALKLNTTAIVVGGPISISSCYIDF